MPAVKRATRCPVAGFGWLFLQESDAQLFDGGPSQQHPDPRYSGQNPQYTAWGIKQLQTIAPSPTIQAQVRLHLETLESERSQAVAAVNSAIAQLDCIETKIAEVSDLIA